MRNQIQELQHLARVASGESERVKVSNAVRAYPDALLAGYEAGYKMTRDSVPDGRTRRGIAWWCGFTIGDKKRCEEARAVMGIVK